MAQFDQWAGFKGRLWTNEVNVRDFVQNNYTPYDGDSSFLAGPTDATTALWNEVQKLQKAERDKGGVLDMETKVVSDITSYGAAYIKDDMKDLEQIVGLQTDKPLKRAFMPYGGIKMAEEACQMYGYTPDPELHKIFTVYHKTHNDGVFDAYTPEMKVCRHNKILTGLPDTYGRGRIVGDYRRVALYGIDFLIKEKQNDFANCGDGTMTDNVIRLREEIAEQIKALKAMKVMAADYGFDISVPAKNAKEAVQWLYFGYLAAIKTQNGAAMSVGRVSTFLDIYIERDLENGVITLDGEELTRQESRRFVARHRADLERLLFEDAKANTGEKEYRRDLQVASIADKAGDKGTWARIAIREGGKEKVLLIGRDGDAPAFMIDGEKAGKEEAVRLIKRDTRHFAKRQLTWFKREKDVIWTDLDRFGNRQQMWIHMQTTAENIIHYKGD